MTLESLHPAQAENLVRQAEAFCASYLALPPTDYLRRGSTGAGWFGTTKEWWVNYLLACMQMTEDAIPYYRRAVQNYDANKLRYSMETESASDTS